LELKEKQAQGCPIVHRVRVLLAVPQRSTKEQAINFDKRWPIKLKLYEIEYNIWRAEEQVLNKDRIAFLMRKQETDLSALQISQVLFANSA
jgi:TfoX/Sxy family transcriptional regulator of competence genes